MALIYKVSSWLHRFPGEKYFGIYRFLPVFFGLGAALEFCMVNWTLNEVNFYGTIKTRQAQYYAEEKIRRDRESAITKEAS